MSIDVDGVAGDGASEQPQPQANVGGKQADNLSELLAELPKGSQLTLVHNGTSQIYRASYRHIARLDETAVGAVRKLIEVIDLESKDE